MTVQALSTWGLDQFPEGVRAQLLTLEQVSLCGRGEQQYLIRLKFRGGAELDFPFPDHIGVVVHGRNPEQVQTPVTARVPNPVDPE